MADNDLSEERRALLLLKDNLQHEAEECEDNLAFSLLTFLVHVCGAVFTTMNDMEDT